MKGLSYREVIDEIDVREKYLIENCVNYQSDMYHAKKIINNYYNQDYN